MPPKKRNLFDDDAADADAGVALGAGGRLKVNASYASRYDEEKRKKDLQRLTDKFGKNVQFAENEEDDDDDELASDGSEEDDNAIYDDDVAEEGFAEVLYRLRTNDPTLKDPNVKFFDPTAAKSQQSKRGGDKQFLLRDEYERTLALAAEGKDVDEAAGDEEQEEVDELPTRKRDLKKRKAQDDVEEEKRRQAVAALNQVELGEHQVKEGEAAAPLKRPAASGSSRRLKTKAHELAFEEETDDDEDDRFLKGFFMNQAWKDVDGNEALKHYDWNERAKDDQDDDFYHNAEHWEKEYQQKHYRHEEGEEAYKVQTFPRQEEGLLRKKDSSRADARARREERQQEQELQNVEELKRLKALKREEIKRKRDKIARIAGMGEGGLLVGGLTKEMLEGDFDPEAHDRMMAKMFDNDYYDDINEEEERLMEQEMDLVGAAGSDDDDDESADGEGHKKQPKEEGDADADLLAGLGEEDMDVLYPTAQIDKVKPSKAAKKKRGKASSTAAAKGDDEESPPDLKKLEEELAQAEDEYYRMHYHKVAGDTRTRFKYRSVNEEHFGLSDLDVFLLDDRRLNQQVPLNSYAAYLTEKQNVVDRYKALGRRKNIHEVDPEYRSRRYKRDTRVFDANADEAEGERIAQAIEQASKKLQDAVEKKDNDGATPKSTRRSGGKTPSSGGAETDKPKASPKAAPRTPIAAPLSPVQKAAASTSPAQRPSTTQRKTRRGQKRGRGEDASSAGEPQTKQSRTEKA